MPSLVPVFERVGSSCLEHLDTLVCDAGTGDKAYLSAMNVRGKTMILKDVNFFLNVLKEPHLHLDNV